MRSVLVSLWVWLAIGTLILLWVPFMAVVWLFDRDPARYNTGLFLRYLGRSLTYVNPFWEIELEGPFPDNPRNPYVVVGNHFSQADPPIISWVPWEMKWVAKIGLFRLPVAGWLLRMSGDIPVDRRSKKSRAEAVNKAKDYLSKECSVMLFPEGTRSRDGQVHRFSDGAFRLAIEEGVPVLPIAIDGTHEALPKHTIWFEPNPETIRVKVLEPVSTDGYSRDDVRALQRHVRANIIAQIAEWRGVALDEVDALHDADAAASDWVDRSPDEVATAGETSVKASHSSDSSEPAG